MSARLDHGDDELTENHEINVTPFIDVMLVLLIIFMVAAPLATVDVPVNLPGSNAQPQVKPPQPVYLTLQADLTLSLGDTPITQEALAEVLDGATEGNKEEVIFLRADETVNYGDLMALMNRLRRAGYLKLALVGLETAAP
ncbi:TonB system transport protein ExbD [Hydrocarboniphaga sp.]|uniref:TonB system transport protein ExbD n=1 Tax=Hydrocarboniphaga sp. TaxID=2033016 RepID=UPI002ABA65E5|nr:TonB system transport protein ExbD [Hydrocarboniphaga sp.]MDZ4077332.1 TonB system transport protein ExbD [Hydrocarboniphaga sp.]